ncbi:MAG: TonB-dependent Receptor Plug Domain protein [Mucilaginibacter sp.]|nr:TonB-dependent Receptor Plug Domain protein [Mucilaginibacter sp.]
MIKTLPIYRTIKMILLIIFINSFANLPSMAEAKGNTQDLEKRITISFDKISLKEGLDKISAKASVAIIYSNSKEFILNSVSIHAINKPLKEVLKQLLAPFSLTFRVIDDKIVISYDAPKLKVLPAENKHLLIIPLKGKVTDTNGQALQGATIRIKGENKLTITDKNGEFAFDNVSPNSILQISFIGFIKKEIAIADDSGYLTIVLETDDSKLDAVSIVSTGYQTLPKERATGSFVLIDSALINRRVGTNILDRLDGVTSGLIFNKSLGTGNNATISIRGRSTIFANPDPLIVVDNFPYDGDITNINPNDVESISILKDAAAASIWGVRAGNGVIVITTKKGRPSDQVHISFNASMTVSSRPNLYYQSQISSTDYIGLEQYLFNRGYYNNTINDGYSTISPAVAIMLQKRNVQISTADSAAQINRLKTLDVRNDLQKYIYRPSFNQQYALSIDGGSKTHTYYVSAGYDKDLQNIAGSSYNRFTLNANNKYYLLQNKLQLTVGLLLVTSKTKNNGNAYTKPLYPYEQLADANGNHLTVVQSTGLRKQYTDTAGTGNLLDWNYRPLDENTNNTSTNLTDYKLNTNLNYQILKGLNVGIYYQYERGLSDYNQLYDANSFYARNLINSFSQIDPTSGNVTSPVPSGGIDNTSNSSYTSSYGRAQINYAKKFGDKHDLNVLAGVEIKDYQSSSIANTLYGFDPSTDSSLPVDNIDYFPEYFGSYNSATIPYLNSKNFTIDRTRSAFANASYVFKSKYTFSASARRDESNIFGVSTNQKGVPLWSSGLMWNINKESFYHFDPLPILKLRVTYGYNGNVDKTTSAYLTAQDGGANFWNTEYTNIINPPNPSLRWEKDRNINFGIDYATKNNLFSGNLDYYIKNGIDLIANSPIAPQTGITQFKGNAADTKTTGVDFVFNKNSIGNSKLRWQSTFLFSYTKDIVTNYKVKQLNNAQIIIGNYANPLQGYPYNAIFSYPFRGLDNKGKPQGLLNGIISENFTGITRSTDASNLTYNGSATPLIYGSFRNSFTYVGFELSINIVYKFDYYFRRANVFSGSNAFGSYGYSYADFDKRWQVPGDELKTNIPALIYPLNSAQNAFFQGSSTLVEKADNIRLQDVRLSYNFKSLIGKPIFKNLQIYAYLNNVGILWKATKQSLDPDYLYSAFVNPKTLSIGLSTNF